MVVETWAIALGIISQDDLFQIDSDLGLTEGSLEQEKGQENVLVKNNLSKLFFWFAEESRSQDYETDSQINLVSSSVSDSELSQVDRISEIIYAAVLGNKDSKAIKDDLHDISLSLFENLYVRKSWIRAANHAIKLLRFAMKHDFKIQAERTLSLILRSVGIEKDMAEKEASVIYNNIVHKKQQKMKVSPRYTMAVFRGNNERCGVFDGPTPSSLRLRWIFETGGEVHSSPIAYNDTVFCGSDDGCLYAIDALSGKLKWKFTTEPKYGLGDLYLEHRIRSSPAIFENIVICATTNGNIYGVNIDTGESEWKYEGYSLIYSSPAIYMGRIFIGLNSGLLALDARNGEIVWHYNRNDAHRSSPAIYDGRIYIGAGAFIIALSAEDGSLIWQSSGDGIIWSTPAVCGGKVFVNYGNRLYAFDSKTGAELWVYRPRDWPLYKRTESSPAVYRKSVYVGIGSSMFSINKDKGIKEWEFKANGEIDASPLACKNGVYFGSWDGCVYLLSHKNGQLKAKYQTKKGIISSPSIYKGMLYIGGMDGNIYAFD